MGKRIRVDASERSHGRPDVEGRRFRQYRLRSLILLVLLIGVWLGILVDPLIGPFARFVMEGVGLTLGVFLGAIALGWLGFGLFAVGDRVVGWVKRLWRWPET